MLWINGALTPPDDARINPRDRGFLLGDGVFETLRVAGGRPFRMAAHLARLRSGAATLGFAVPFADAVLADACSALAAGRDGVLRLTCSRGPAERGILPPDAPSPTAVIAWGALPEFGPPLRLIVSRQTRRNEFSPLSRIKSLNYGDGILARLESQAAGAEDAILFNTAGRIAEATAASIVALQGGAWMTPPVQDGALPGLARAALIAAGMVREGRPDPARCEAVVLVNSLSARPAAWLDGRSLNVEAAAGFVSAAASVLWRPERACG